VSRKSNGRDPYDDAEPVLTKNGVVVAVKGKHRIVENRDTGFMEVVEIGSPQKE
jgi:hypothetical protein